MINIAARWECQGDDSWGLCSLSVCPVKQKSNSVTPKATDEPGCSFPAINANDLNSFRC